MASGAGPAKGLPNHCHARHQRPFCEGNDPMHEALGESGRESGRMIGFARARLFGATKWSSENGEEVDEVVSGGESETKILGP